MTERTLQRYRLLEEVGQGGMAVVYKGFDTTLNREVAVKVLHPHLAGQEESRARLQREAHAVAKLRHENILEIFDYSGPDSPESYIVTEFIHGKTLKIFLNDNPLPFPEVAEMIASEVARALEHAHALGVIHRDVKPENVMIRDDGLCKLMDFGIAQIVDKERMTVTGQLLGSPAYMAPEHVEGRPLDFRTDVFALGILTYQLATGQLPFRGKNPHEVLKRIAECKFAPPESVNPLVGARLGRVIKKALEREPASRFADVAPMRRELLDDLADAGVDDPRRELARFFADPKGWAKEFRPRLVERLTARGREEAARGRTAAALEFWGRALGLEPKSPELRALVDGVARQRRMGRAAIVGGVLVAVTAAASFGARALLLRPRPPVEKRDDGNRGVDPKDITGPKNAAVNPAEKSPNEKSLNVKPPVAPEHHPPVKVVRHVIAPPPPEPTPPVAEVRRAFKLNASPKNVSVAIDGTSIQFDPGNPTILVGPGSHHLAFSNPACVTTFHDITPDAPGGDIIAHLPWQPGIIIVTTDPPNADILAENRPYHSGQPIRVNFGNGKEHERTVALRVSAEHYESQTIEVKVGAGDEKHPDPVKLNKQGE
ncbi:MAG TPA: serine/threonine-protein kinase [Polyangia bacterium]|nr:serine/threonine-protein kinase [Polyangia bacterium]